MPREITDADGVRWTLAQAYAGLSTAAPDAAVSTEPVRVVCTPSGGAQTVDLDVPGNWETALSDEDLAAQIADARS